MASKSLYAIIAGVGPGTGRSVALRFAQKYPVVLFARRPESYESTLKDVEDAGGKAIGISADVSDPASLKKAFDAIGKELPDSQLAAAIYNVGSGGFAKKPFLELTENDLNASLDGSIRSFFNFAQATIPHLLEAVPNSQYPPTMVLTGATASIKGSAQFSTFAAGKWGQRAMHQSLAREFGPKGIHIAHAVIDGIIDIPRTKAWAANNGVEDGKISPDAIAEAYWNLHTQHRSAFTQEIDIRPYVENCLATAITDLHCQAFKTPAFFVHVGFIENKVEKGTYFVAGKSHDVTSNRIIGTVRTSAARTKEDFDTLGAKIEAAWYHAQNLQSPTEKTSWNAEDELKRLIMVMFVPMITIREGGMAIPEAGQEQSWLDEQLPYVESLADKGIEDFSGLIHVPECRLRLTGSSFITKVTTRAEHSPSTTTYAAGKRNNNQYGSASNTGSLASPWYAVFYVVSHSLESIIQGGLKSFEQVSLIHFPTLLDLTVAVWVRGYDFEHVRVSGVGRWDHELDEDEDDDEEEDEHDKEEEEEEEEAEGDDLSVATGSSRDGPVVSIDFTKRWDDPSGPGPRVRVHLQHKSPETFYDGNMAWSTYDEPVPVSWGFGFHASCWTLLNKPFTPDLRHPFAACLSMPSIGSVMLDWGHNYGGAAISVKGPCGESLETRLRAGGAAYEELRFDPYHIQGINNIITSAACLQNAALSSRLTFGGKSLGRDEFCHLPTDILDMIAILLPTSDIHALRLASPVFATMDLSGSFWASRFQPDNEFGYLFEAREHSPKSCRTLYLSLAVWAPIIPGLSNRKRIWTLARDLEAILSQMTDVPCMGLPLATWFEGKPKLDQQDRREPELSWHTAERAIAKEDDYFQKGCRPLRARALCFSQPLKIQRMSVSFVTASSGKFVSGLLFIDQDGQPHAIGYQHEDAMIHVKSSTAQYMMGWELAFDISGIKAIAIIYENGKASAWAGDPSDLPRWRLIGNQCVSAIKAEFDAFKLVTLSRDDSDDYDGRIRLNHCLWYPEVPPNGLLFTDRTEIKPFPANERLRRRYLTEPSRDKFEHPRTTLFFGEGDGRYLSSLREIVIWVHDFYHIRGIEFRFTNAALNRHLGSIGPIDESSPYVESMSRVQPYQTSILIDGAAGERLSSLGIFKEDYRLTGFKLNTNFGQHLAHPEFSRPEDDGVWVNILPGGSEVVGIFATMHGGTPIDIGLISKDPNLNKSQPDETMDGTHW
ncbi:hypothetical protein FGRMN_306 [Fusarium graminum]|nr:hypothetical protein FGRMN_306 [Fusarium graminum]